MSRRKLPIVLSDLAQEDFADILQYTLEIWSEKQMDAYASKLEKGMRLLETNAALGIARDDLFEGCRVLPVEHHLVLYVAGDGVIAVARILHERMNVDDQF